MLGASKGHVQIMKKGLLGLPTDYAWGLPPMRAVPQSAKDIAFGSAVLKAGCKVGVYEKMDKDIMRERIRQGYLLSSAFNAWQWEDEDGKGRFVVNLSRQGKFLPEGSCRMDRMVEFSGELKQGERLLSFDVTAGYGHVHLHPLMLGYFIFSYAGVTYRCLELSFWLRPSALHSTRFLRPLVTYLRNVLGCRALWYLDGLMISPTVGKATTKADCLRASERLDHVLRTLGIEKIPTKGVWGEGACEFDHLGFHLSTLTMSFTVTTKKLVRMRRQAGKLLRQGSQGQKIVSV